MFASLILLLVDTICGFLSIMLLARFYMQWQRVSFNNPIGSMVLSLTDWLVLKLRRVLPPIRYADSASLLPAWLLQVLVVAFQVVLSELSFGDNPGLLVGGLLLAGIIELLRLFIYLILAVVFMGAILSWVNPYAPIAPTIRALSNPYLEPIRRRLPHTHSVDLSPLILIVALQIASNLLAGLRQVVLSFV
jgi:YggT family protein